MKRPKLSTVLICTALLIFFVLIKFPLQNSRGYLFEKIYAQTNVFIVADDISPSFFGWPGLAISNVDVTLPVAGKELDLSSQKLIFRVGLGGLFPPRLAFSFKLKGLKKGGNLYVRYTGTKTKIDLTSEASRVALEQLAFSGLSEAVAGELTADVDVSVQKDDLSKTSGDGQLNIDKLKIPTQNIQGFVLPALNIGTVKSKINVKNGIAELSNFQFGDATSDLRGSLVGEVKLGAEVMQCFLNATLRFQLSDKYRQDPKAETLVTLLEGYRSPRTGDYAMKWAASFDQMNSNIATAIPQKIPD